MKEAFDGKKKGLNEAIDYARGIGQMHE